MGPHSLALSLDSQNGWSDSKTITTPNSHDSFYNDKMSEVLGKSIEDAEAQPILDDAKDALPSTSTAVEYRTPLRTKLTYLAGYFLLNLGLTLYNKALLGNVNFVFIFYRLILTHLTVPFPMASYSFPRRISFVRMLHS
jgi:hypothetical protein